MEVTIEAVAYLMAERMLRPVNNDRADIVMWIIIEAHRVSCLLSECRNIGNIKQFTPRLAHTELRVNSVDMDPASIRWWYQCGERLTTGQALLNLSIRYIHSLLIAIRIEQPADAILLLRYRAECTSPCNV